MAQPTDDLLAQRRLRSTELALDGARARLAEASGELDDLRARVDELEAELLAREAAYHAERDQQRNPDIEAFETALARETARRRLAEQALQAERARAEELAAQLRGDGLRVDDGSVERELAVALARIGALEGELEMVRRLATEFEHGVRRNLNAAWDWLEDLGARFSDALNELEALQQGEHREGGEHQEGGEHDGDPWAASTDEHVEPERLDEALHRLRAQAPERAPEPDPSAVRNGRRRRLRRASNTARRITGRVPRSERGNDA